MIHLQLAPNVDYRRLLGHQVLGQVDQVGVYSQMIFGDPITAPNHTLLETDVLPTLSLRSIPVSVEIGSVKDLVADDHYLHELDRLVDLAGEHVDVVGMDEPVRYSDRRTTEDLAEAIATWIQHAHRLGFRVKWFEATPHTPWHQRVKPVLSRVWELAPFEQLTLDIDGRALLHEDEASLTAYRADLEDMAAWVDDRRDDTGSTLTLGVTVISPSIPRRRSHWDRLQYAIADLQRVGYSQAWSDGKYRPCETRADFRASIAEQRALLPFRPDVYDFHSWERRIGARPGESGWPRTLPTFEDHVALVQEAVA